jgi:hypothetical protein
MSILAREEYRGAGRADPEKTRAERQQELLGLLETASGKGVIEHYFGKYTGVPEGNCPPASLLMVQTLLDKEYPKY